MTKGDQTIRRCVASDARAIAAIYDPIVAETSISFEEVPPGALEIERRLAEAGSRYPWLACERDGELVGFAYSSQHRTRAAYRWSVDVSIYVSENSRCRGVARALYGQLFSVLTRQGYQTAFAGIALPNEASVALHRGLQFETVGVYHNVGYKLGAWRDVIWLERRLGKRAAPISDPRPWDGVL